MHGQLDELAYRRLEQVRPVRVHQARVVGEAVFRDERRRAPGGLPARAAEAVRLDAEAVEHGERTLEVGALGGLVLVEGTEVRVRVVADLVAGLEDAVDGLRIALGRQAGHEERRRQRVLGQQREDARHADERPVRLV